MEDTSIVRYIIGSSRVKFTVLDEMFSDIPTDKYKMCCLLIDGHSIFNRLYRPDNIPLYDQDLSETVADIVVNFMNVIGHYRRYIATRLKLSSDIFVSYNTVLPKYQGELFPMYYERRLNRRLDDKYKFITSAIDKAWTFISTISNYFEGIYCIDAPGIDDFTTLGVASRMSSMNYEVLKLIITKSEYAHQMLTDDRTYIIYEKRDDSYLISKDNCFAKGIAKNCKNGAEFDKVLVPRLLPMMWALSGLKDVSVGSSPFTGLNTPSNICKVTAKMMKEDGYNPNTISFNEFVRTLPDYCKWDYLIHIKPRYQTLLRRYRALDYRLSEAAITPSQKSKLQSGIIDLFDENELERLNEVLAMNKVNPELFELANLHMSNAAIYF